MQSFLKVIGPIILIVLTACQKWKTEQAEAPAPKDQPQYTVPFDPNRSPATK